jgi:hypothetical protein
MVRPFMAATVFSTKPDSFSVSVWIITCTSYSSATERQQSMAPGVVPQSSCSLSAQAPPRSFPPARRAARRCPCRRGRGSPGRRPPPAASARYARGRACRWWRACHARAGAAAEHGGHAGMQRVLDLLGADEVDVAVEAAGGEDLALAGDGLGAGADDDVDAGLGVGVAGLADGGDAAVLEADIGLVDAGPVDDQRVGDDGVDGALGAGALAAPCRRGSPCRRRISLPRRRL